MWRISMTYLSRKKNENFWRVLLVGLILLLPVEQAVDAADEAWTPNKSQQCPRDPRMDPTYEVHHGQDVIWQIPPNPKAILFLAHGGYKDPLSFFDQGPKCDRCYGLPEDRAVALEALDRGYAVIAIKSIGIGFDSWPPEASQDLVIAVSVIEKWRREQSLESLPLTAWGHSAGGFFVTTLILKLPFRAIVLMCSDGLIEVEQIANPVWFPPTFFAYMPVDKETVDITTKAEKAMAVLRGRGVHVAEKLCWPKPLSPLFFTERIRCMPSETSAKIYGAFKAEGWLDSKGFLTKNPSAEDWEAVLWKWNVLPFCKESGDLCLAQHVEQELHMAYALHSLTSDANEEIFPWLDSRVLSSDHSVSPYHAFQ